MPLRTQTVTKVLQQSFVI